MKILLILSDNYNIDYYFNTLSEITDKEQVITINSLYEADNFIKNEIFKKQLEIDIILLQNKFPHDYQTGQEYHRRIQFDFDHTYSNNDFNWRSVPVMLLLARNENKDAIYRQSYYEYNDLINYPERLQLYIPDIIRKVKSWRKKLLDELSNLGIDYKSGLLDYSNMELKKLGNPTIILSENFKTIHRKLNYAWLNTNFAQIEQSIDEFIKELKRSERYNKKDEKKFHNFFKKYPLFIKRDVYRQHWYEPRFHHHEDSLKDTYYEPDFALKPSFTKNTDLSILEIKLPQERFITKSKFHPSPYHSFIKHLIQVSDYKDYLESEEASKEIVNALGFDPRKFDYHLLIGRQEYKEEVQDILDRRLNQLNMNFIKLTTYDELMEYQVRFLQRLKLLEIK